jgi:biopolymer transport protein ExbD
MVRTHSRSAPPLWTINLSGFTLIMSTVVLVVLMIFMTYSPGFHPLTVHFPWVSNAVAMPRAYRYDVMIVAINREGKVFLRSERVEPQHLPAMIREQVQSGAENKVYLAVDPLARYEVVTHILAEVRAAGVNKVAFLTQYRSP